NLPALHFLPVVGARENQTFPLYRLQPLIAILEQLDGGSDDGHQMALLQNTPATIKTRYKTSWPGAPPPFVLRQALGHARSATFHLFWQVTIHLLYCLKNSLHWFYL